MVPTGSLPQNVCLLLWEALQEVEELSWHFCMIFGRDMPKHVAVQLWDTVYMPAVVYKLLFATLTEAEIAGAMKHAWGAYKSRLGLSRSTTTAVAQSMGIGEVYHRLMVERLTVLMRCLESPKQKLRLAAAVSLRLETLWESSGGSALAAPHCAERGWSGLWVGDLRKWMRTQNMNPPKRLAY